MSYLHSSLGKATPSCGTERLLSILRKTLNLYGINMFLYNIFIALYMDSTNKGDGFESFRIIEAAAVASKKSRLVHTGTEFL